MVANGSLGALRDRSELNGINLANAESAIAKLLAQPEEGGENRGHA